VESRFGILEGVIRTRVGYAGGLMAAPTYRLMGDHTETVQVDYDPRRITYDRLLEIFWASHRPTSGSRSRQYMNVILYHSDQQRRLALASKNAVEQRVNGPVKTSVLPVRSFTTAEDYHQKYSLNRQVEIHREMSRSYPRRQDFVASTAVARLNGYAGGYGTRDQLLREIDLLGLSDGGKQALSDLVRK
jgi:methionine-S-sulfoxide reductase